MTLGPQVIPMGRLAGTLSTWGVTLELPAGFTTVGQGLRELVRASIGVPVTWTIVGAFSPDDPADAVQLIAKPGLGQVNIAFPFKGMSGVDPVTAFPSPGIPATELVVYCEVTKTLAARARVSCLVAPVAWPSWVSPSRVNGW